MLKLLCNTTFHLILLALVHRAAQEPENTIKFFPLFLIKYSDFLWTSPSPPHCKKKKKKVLETPLT